MTRNRNHDEYDLIIQGTPFPEPNSPAGAPQPTGSVFGALKSAKSAQASGEDEEAFAIAPDDPTLEAPAIKDTEHAVRLWMTAMKLFNPLVRAVITQDIENYSPDELMMEFFRLLKATNRLTASLVERLKNNGGLDVSQAEHRWVLRQIVPLVTQTVADQWRKHGSAQTQIIDTLYQTVLQIISEETINLDTERLQVDNAILEAASFDDRFLRIPADKALLLSQFGALEPLVTEIGLFSAWQDPQELITDLSSIHVENAEFLYQKHNDQMLSPRSRLVLLQACLQHAGALLHDTYRLHAGNLLAEYEALPDDQRASFRQRYAPGAPEALEWRRRLAADARGRVQLLHEAALAGRRALDTLLEQRLPDARPRLD